MDSKRIFFVAHIYIYIFILDLRLRAPPTKESVYFGIPDPKNVRILVVTGILDPRYMYLLMALTSPRCVLKIC